jgi:ribosome assembly protein YihI (activator of Der GTPase)
MSVEKFVASLNDEQLQALLEALENDESVKELYECVEALMDARGL